MFGIDLFFIIRYILLISVRMFVEIFIVVLR